MTRKESEKDSERPHYYSQFWLDVAAGRKIIGVPRTEEGEPVDIEVPEPVAPRRPTRASADQDGMSASRADNGFTTPSHTEPEAETEEFSEPEAELDLLTNDLSDLDYPEAGVEEADIPDMDLSPVDEEEEFFEEEEEEEEEEDESWGRGRKKAKPTRTTKQPPKRPGKREPRRGGF